MLPYKERLPLIDEAIKQGLKQEDGEYVFWGHGLSMYYYGNDVDSHRQDLICTRQEFEQRTIQWRNLYEWCMKTDQVTFEDFLSNAAMKEWAIACAEQQGFDWQDTLEQRPYPATAKCATIDNLEFGGYGVKGDDGVWTFSIQGENTLPHSDDFDDKSWTEEQEMDNDWYEKGVNPPVGEIVRIIKNGLPPQDIEIMDYRDNQVVFWSFMFNEARSTKLKGVRFEPVRTETDNLALALYREINYNTDLNDEQIIKSDRFSDYRKAIEQCYRKIKPMTEDEFVKSIHKYLDTKQFDVEQLSVVFRSTRTAYKAGCRFLDSDAQ